MGIRIDGSTDQISAADGSLTIEGQSINTTGIVTATGGMKVGTAATIHSTGQFNVGVAATIFANGNATYSGIVTAASYIGDGSALTGVGGTEITNSDFSVGISTLFVDYSTGRTGIGTIVPAGLLHLVAADNGASYSANAADTLILERNGACVIDIKSTAVTEGGLVFSDQNARAVGRILYNHTNNSINFTTDSAERLNILGDGRVAIASSLALSGVCTAAAFIPAQGWLGNRNVIINGGMTVAQRATSSTDTGCKTVDRWQISNANTDELAFAQKQTASYPNGFSKCYEFDVTTAESALAADELTYIRYKVEAQDLRPFYNGDGTGKDFTLSFWVRAKQTGTYQVSIHKEDNTTRFISSTYAYAVADTWQFVQWNVTGDTGTSGINADNGQGFDITWKLAVGTDYTSGTPVTSWGSFSNSVFAAGQAVNVLDNTANYFKITGVQLEVGSVATPFEHRTYGEELTRCQRYYTRTGVLTGQVGAAYGKAYSTSEMFTTVCFPTSMRATPTVTTYNNGGTAAGVHKLGNPDITSIASIDRGDTRGFGRVNKTSAWATGDTDMYSFTWEASAEL